MKIIKRQFNNLQFIYIIKKIYSEKKKKKKNKIKILGDLHEG